ncbi:periplasmic binding protein-like II [Lentithecium fluviatile CBS 122367]|uniref:Periplasmic binding protein-like II n=1 Tax=Lentithecium fluviatile CBS 122367 TaxID=1168545 RepID=A0A6G1JBL2_9PLEO|nr:periplasmic binding protein-like II [Lentithecium fluviatile CBS 122367]
MYYLLVALFVPLTLGLKIGTSLQWIEHTPQPYAVRNFYKGSSTATISSGGVANLGSDTSFDLAANAETQGLKQYANHRNIRLIYTICEVPYRIVANKASGIKTLADLKGKKIGTMKGTSAGVFVQRMMASVGIQENQYTIASGNVCMKAPCASDTLPAMLKNKQIDAFGIWEAAVELGAQAIGDSAIIFQNASVYREIYSLYSTTQKLNDPAKRKDIVAFVRALNQTLGVFNEKPESVYDFVAKEVNMDVKVVKDVWKDHWWVGQWGKDVPQLLVEEDAYLAKTDGRAKASQKELETFLDDSVIKEL